MVYDYAMKCDYCGEDNKQDSLYCMACGTRISGGEAPGSFADNQGTTLAFPESGSERQAAHQTSSGFVFGTPPDPSDAQPGPSAVIEVGPSSPIMGEPDYLLPPEADYPFDSPKNEAMPSGTLPHVEPPSPAPVDATQAISPVTPVKPDEAAKRRVICPECYAANTEQNRYCQECGNPLALRSSRPVVAAQVPAAAGATQHTAVLPAEMVQQAVAEQAETGRRARAEKVHSDRSFGVADVVALLAVVAGGLAISPVFAWKKGLTISVFSHQGAFFQGRTDLLGGPGLLPYSGAEFLTVGLIAAIGIGLAVLFLALRFGRGPMLILAGSLLLFPLIYLLFQGILPLRETGFNLQSLGLGEILFGGGANVGAGPALWLLSGGGLLFLLAGFLAPPRGWGRLFTFMLIFSLIVGAAFFCAATYNWNLFISNPAMIAFTL
ncbi:MAG: hypothetical protein A2W01_09005 [Candidatus Solincola sediminis]|nr:MAG: hypothetical protein A2W01_09005 [Candidatus Solincola sediminis]